MCAHIVSKVSKPLVHDAKCQSNVQQHMNVIHFPISTWLINTHIMCTYSHDDVYSV